MEKEINKGSIGQVLQSQAEFCCKIESDRIAKKELGGGACLDIGIYCVQFSQFVFGGEKPEKVVASGFTNEEGVDCYGSVTFLYSGGRAATFQYSSKVDAPCEAHVYGTDGSMSLKFPFWCSNKLQLKDGKVVEFPLPEGLQEFNFFNSAGLGYEAQHVRECLLKCLKESPAVPHSETMTIAELMEDIRKQIGVVYEQDA